MSTLPNLHPNRLNSDNKSKVRTDLVTSLESYLSWTWYNPFSWFPVQRKKHGHLAKKLLTDLNKEKTLENIFSKSSFTTDSDKDLLENTVSNQDDFVTALDPVLVKVNHLDLKNHITIGRLFSSLVKSIKECLKTAPTPATSITEKTLNTVTDYPEHTTGIVTSAMTGTAAAAAGYSLLPIVAIAAATGAAGYGAICLYNYFMTPTKTTTKPQTGNMAIVVGNSSSNNQQPSALNTRDA